MRHLHCCRMRLEMIVDPSREDGRFHSRRPRPWKRLHPHVQSQSRGGYRTFCIDTSPAVPHAVVDRFLVNIQTDVVHIFHGGASLVVSESARSLSSAFLHQALLHRLIHSNNSGVIARRFKSHAADMLIISDTIRSEVADESLVISCPEPSTFFSRLFWADNAG